jgi:hypothetical protein
MGEDECGAGNVADLAGADGDVLEGAPALVEQREPAFAEAAQGALEGIAGAGGNIEFPSAGARPAAASQRTAPVPLGRQAWHDRRSRGAFQQKLILW